MLKDDEIKKLRAELQTKMKREKKEREISMTKILELTRSTVLLGAESSTMGAEATSFIEFIAPLEMTD